MASGRSILPSQWVERTKRQLRRNLSYEQQTVSRKEQETLKSSQLNHSWTLSLFNNVFFLTDSSNRHNFAAGCINVPLGVFTSAIRTLPSLPGNVFRICPKGQCERGGSSFFIRIRYPSFKFSTLSESPARVGILYAIAAISCQLVLVPFSTFSGCSLHALQIGRVHYLAMLARWGNGLASALCHHRGHRSRK